MSQLIQVLTPCSLRWSMRGTTLTLPSKMDDDTEEAFIPVRGSAWGSAKVSIALAELRPGSIPQGFRPVQPDAKPAVYHNPALRAQFKVHWEGHDRCPTKRLVIITGNGTEVSTLNGKDFLYHINEGLRVCSWCRRAFLEA